MERYVPIMMACDYTPLPQYCSLFLKILMTCAILIFQVKVRYICTDDDIVVKAIEPKVG